MTPTIFHLWSGNYGDEDAVRRMKIAQRSWNRECATYDGKWVEVDQSAVEFPRNSESVGDKARLPFVHDMLNAVAETAQDADILLITNADIGLFKGFAQEAATICAESGAFYCHRWDFPKLTKSLQTKEEIGAGKWYVGADAFGFTAKWWRENKADIPEFILGRECWDWIFREKIKESGGKEMHKAIYHETHASPWKTGRLYHPGNLYNRSYARVWLEIRQMDLREITNAPVNKVVWPIPAQTQAPQPPVEVRAAARTVAAFKGQPMDVLIVLGQGSKWDNNELRYCLRSLEKNAVGLGRVFVVGHNPGFLSDKVIVHARADAGKNKEHNIAEHIMWACDNLDITERFLWVNDDMFLLERTDIGAYPYFWDGKLEQKWQKTKLGGYRAALAQTNAQLQMRKMPTNNYEMHVPISYAKTLFSGLKGWLALSSAVPFGMTFRSVYANVVGVVPGPIYKDMKLGSTQTAEELQGLLVGRHCVSIGDGLGDGAKAYINSLFPEKSTYES